VGAPAPHKPHPSLVSTLTSGSASHWYKNALIRDNACIVSFNGNLNKIDYLKRGYRPRYAISCPTLACAATLAFLLQAPDVVGPQLHARYVAQPRAQRRQSMVRNAGGVGGRPGPLPSLVAINQRVPVAGVDGFAGGDIAEAIAGEASLVRVPVAATRWLSRDDVVVTGSRHLLRGGSPRGSIGFAL